jgi:hypothetical protein
MAGATRVLLVDDSGALGLALASLPGWRGRRWDTEFLPGFPFAGGRTPGSIVRTDLAYRLFPACRRGPARCGSERNLAQPRGPEVPVRLSGVGGEVGGIGTARGHDVRAVRVQRGCEELSGFCARTGTPIGPRGPSRGPIGCTSYAHRKQKTAVSSAVPDGETRTRTGDTTIFSRVLYQLSYLAAAERISPWLRRSGAVWTRAQARSSISGSMRQPPGTRRPRSQISKCRCGPLAAPLPPTWQSCWPR